MSDESEAVPKVGRNEPCPCGSGEKYKMCHGRTEPVEEPDQPPPGMEAVELPIEKEIRYVNHGTAAVPTDDGMKISFIVTEGGQPVQMTFQVGAEGKKHIREVANSGTGKIVTPDLVIP